MGQEPSSLAVPSSSSDKTESSRKRGMDPALDVFRSKKLKLEGKSVVLNRHILDTRRVTSEWTSDEEYNKSGTPSPVRTPNSASQDADVVIKDDTPKSEALDISADKPVQDVSRHLGSNQVRCLLHKKGIQPEKAKSPIEFNRYDRGLTGSGYCLTPMRGRAHTSPSELSPVKHKRKRLFSPDSKSLNGTDNDIQTVRSYRPQSAPNHIPETKFAQTLTRRTKLERIEESVSATGREQGPDYLDNETDRSGDVRICSDSEKRLDGSDGTKSFLDTLLEKTISDLWADSESKISRKRFGLLYFLRQKNDTGKSHTCQCPHSDASGSMLSSLLTKRAKPEVLSESEDDSGNERPDTPTWLALYEKDADPEQIAAFAKSSRNRKTKKRRTYLPQKRHTFSVLPQHEGKVQENHHSLRADKPVLAGTDCADNIRKPAELFVSKNSVVSAPSMRTSLACTSVQDYPMSTYTRPSNHGDSQPTIYSQAPCAPPPHVSISTDPPQWNNTQATTRCTFANQLTSAENVLKTVRPQPTPAIWQQRTREPGQVRFPTESLPPGLIKVEPDDIPLPPPLIDMGRPTPMNSRLKSGQHFYPNQEIQKSDYNHNDTTMDYYNQSRIGIYHSENQPYLAGGRLYTDTRRVHSTYNYNNELSRRFIPASYYQLQRRKNPQPKRISPDSQLISPQTNMQSPVYPMYTYGNQVAQPVPLIVQSEQSLANVPVEFAVSTTYPRLMPHRCQDKAYYGLQNIDDPVNLSCYSK